MQLLMYILFSWIDAKCFHLSDSGDISTIFLLLDFFSQDHTWR